VQRSSLYVLAPPVGAVHDTVSVVWVTTENEGVPGILGSVSWVEEAEKAPSPVALVPRTAKLYVVLPTSEGLVVVESPASPVESVQVVVLLMQYWSL